MSTTTMTTPDVGFQERIGRIESQIAEIEKSATPAVRDAARDVVRALLELHGAGLARILEIARQSGTPMATAFAEDELLSNLLLLHDLHPAEFESRVQAAVEKLRVRVSAEHKTLELTEIAGGNIRLKLSASPLASNCGSSAARLRQEIEQAIWTAAPDAAGLQIEEPVAPPVGFVSLDRMFSAKLPVLATGGNP